MSSRLLAVALLLLALARERTLRLLGSAREWLMRNALKVGAGLVAVLGVVLIRNGIAGLSA